MWSWRSADAQEEVSLEIHEKDVISVLLGIFLSFELVHPPRQVPLSILVSVRLLCKLVGGFE